MKHIQNTGISEAERRARGQQRVTIRYKDDEDFAAALEELVDALGVFSYQEAIRYAVLRTAADVNQAVAAEEV